MRHGALGSGICSGSQLQQALQVFDKDELEKVVAESKRTLHLAQEYSSAASKVEKGLIKALKARYPQDGETGEVLDRRYADAMGPIYHSFPDDLDVMPQYVDALMNLTPWKLWDLRTGESAEGARTLEAKQILERGLSQDSFISTST